MAAEQPTSLRDPYARVLSLKGHTDSVLTLEVSAPSSAVFSGSEDGTIRQWSLKSGECQLVIKVPNGEPVTSIAGHPVDTHMIFVGAGANIYSFDVSKNGLLGSTLSITEEEINSITFDDKGTFLAVADDSNDVKIVDMKTQKIARTIRKHTNSCNSVKFRPTKPREVISGGFDCNILLTDYTKLKFLATLNTNAEQPGGPQIVNPPYVFNLATTNDGNWVLAALGDGSIDVFSLILSYRLGRIPAHESAASQVHLSQLGWPGFYVLSAGNDSRVCIWKIKLPEKQAITNFINTMNKPTPKPKGKAPAESPRDPIPPAVEHELSCKIEHPYKINCITTTTESSIGNLFVADTSNDISVYLIAKPE